MTDYRSTEEKLEFSELLTPLVASVMPRLKSQGTREGTGTGPSPDGKLPFLETFERYPDLPYVETLAHAIVESWLESPIVVYEEDILVGVPRPPCRPLVEHFSWGIQYHKWNLDDPAYRDRRDDIAARIEAQKHRLFPLGDEHMEREREAIFGDERHYIRGLWWAGGYQGHTVSNYKRLLERGIEGTLADVRKYASNTNDEEKLSLYRALETLLHGMTSFALLYAKEAERTADECAVDRSETAERLRLVAENCRAVAYSRPRTYYQAAQLVWFYSLWDWVDCMGRVDMYMYPFYERATKLPEAFTAEDVTAALFLKFMEHGVHNIPLGGVSPEDGTDSTNELSYLILQLARRLHTVHPRLVARIHRSSPKEFLHLIVRMWSEGMSDPTLVSDELVIPALCRYGVSIEDARDYTTLGCQEIEIPGRSNFGCEDGVINLAKIFEYTINDGCDRFNGHRIGLPTGHLADYSSVEELWEAYMSQVRYFVERWVRITNRGQEIRRANFAKLVKTLFTDDCIARGRSLDDGGSIYNYGVVETAGASAVADSFAAIDTLVFGRGAISAERLEEAIAANFEGYERERLMLLNSAPKYGNDDELADMYMARLLDEFWSECGRHRSVRGGVFTGACSLLTGGIGYGRDTWAMPDGRFAGTELGNTIGPRTGADRSGITAMLNSVQKLPLNKGIGGTTLNVLLPTYVTATEEQRANVEALMLSYMLNGGQMVQVTTASREDMLEAQRSPELHGDLIVRVGGFSTRFIELDETTQNEIIHRYGAAGSLRLRA